MKVVVVLAGLGLAFWSTSVFAGNDEGIALGDEAALTGGAVAAKVSDGSSLFYNPAGLAAADPDQVDVSATATLLRFYTIGTHYAYGTGTIGGVLFDTAPGASIPARNSAISAQVHELGIYLGSSLYF